MKGQGRKNGKSSKLGKAADVGKGVQTISSMFKQQTSKKASESSQNIDSTSDDNDVIIVEDEIKGPPQNCVKRKHSLSLKRPSEAKRFSSTKRGKKIKVSVSDHDSQSHKFSHTSLESESKNNSHDIVSEPFDSPVFTHETREHNLLREKHSVTSNKAFPNDTVEKTVENIDEEEMLTPENEGSRVRNELELKKSSTPCEENDKEHSLIDTLESTSEVGVYNMSGTSTSRSLVEQRECHSTESLSEAETVSRKDVSNGKELQEFSEPYYFNNFETILSTVLDDAANFSLFDKEDVTVIDKYKSLSDAAKKMYIRLFCRKLKWIPLEKIHYPEIGVDSRIFLAELVHASLIHDDKDLTDLQEVLKSLSAADIKVLAKVYHLPPAISQKGQQVQELLKRTQQTNISSMFGASGNDGLRKSMLSRAKKFLTGVYKLNEVARAVFMRVMMLFSVVNTSLDEDSGIGGQGQLFQMLMVNMGKVVYPEYQVQKTHKIFDCREDVIRFSQALQLEYDMQQATENGKWDDAFSVFLIVKERLKEFEAEEMVVRWNKSLPDYLRAFTATSVLHRLLSQGIEILQRQKDFQSAVDLLRTLLGQEDYCCTHRGYWWERLALNLDVHLKKSEESFEVVLKGLADPYVQVGHRLALFQRGETICQRPKLKLNHRLQECVHEPVRDLPKVYLEGRVLHNSTGAAPRFLTQASYRSNGDGEGGVGDLTVCGVEEFVLDYYRSHGFPSGIHAEGSVVSSLFALYFWDILFLPRPDAFHSPYQAMPLDLYSNSFYNRRKEEIDSHLKKLADSSIEELQSIAADSWAKHEGILCVGMNWERMRSADCVKELVGCIGAHHLSGILKRYAQCPRHTRSGFPDLTLWNATSGTFKICEVKGPGDRLSHKQILWLDYLLKLGVDAEVCHVKAVAAKRLMPVS